MDITLNLHGNERDYIEACVRKERWAQKKIYEDHYSSVFPLCARYSNNDEDALDIMHDGFIKIFKNIDKYKIGTSLSSWIKRIMVNTAIDYYRKQKRRRTEDIDDAREIKNLDPDVLSELAAEEILSSLQDLSPAYRSVFNLYILEGFSHREISERLGISESTSRSNLVKARSKLRTLLTEKGLVKC